MSVLIIPAYVGIPNISILKIFETNLFTLKDYIPKIQSKNAWIIYFQLKIIEHFIARQLQNSIDNFILMYLIACVYSIIIYNLKV